MSMRSTPKQKAVKPLIAEPHAPALPFPVDVLPIPLARFVTEVAASLPCPPDFVAVPMLALLGCAIGTSRVLRVKPGCLEGPRIYAAVVGEAGTKKSPALKLAAAPFFERQRTIFQHYLRGEDLGDQASSDALHPPHGPLSAPSERHIPGITTPHMGDEASPPQLFTTDTTLEAMIMLLAQHPRGVVLIQDELSAWVGAMNQYRGGKGADRQRWLSFWNGAQVMVNRKSRRQPIVLDNPLVCVAGCVPDEILSELSDERGREDGLIPRLLFGCPDPMPVSWTDAAVSEQALHAYQQVFDRLWALQGDLGQAGAGPPPPLELGFTVTGRDAFIALANRLYDALADHALPSPLRPTIAKMDGQAARLSLILHVCRVVCGEIDDPGVDAHSVEAAVHLVEYFIAHATRVYARLRSTRADQRAAQACRWIRSAGGSCTVRDLQRYRVAGVRLASEAEKLVRDLLDLGHGRVEARQLSSGRTQKVFVLHADDG